MEVGFCCTGIFCVPTGGCRGYESILVMLLCMVQFLFYFDLGLQAHCGSRFLLYDKW